MKRRKNSSPFGLTFEEARSAFSHYLSFSARAELETLLLREFEREADAIAYPPQRQPSTLFAAAPPELEEAGLFPAA